MKIHKRYCDNSVSWNCCFSQKTKVVIKEKNDILEKSINEIKKDDLILTYVNGEKNLLKLNIRKNMMMNLSFMNLNV